jgi:putative ABC transport system permease protein
VSLSITTLHKRLPEVGTRKVIGARNRDFMAQFFIESTIINILSLLLAITVIQLIKAPAEYLFHFYITSWKTIVTQHFPVLVLAPLGGIILTGIYPVLVSSRKGAVHLLRKLRRVQTPWWIKSLVTFQYASAVILLIWIGAVYFQLDYIINKNVGIEQEGILVIDCPILRKEDFNTKLDYFTAQSRATKGVLQVSISRSVVGDETGVPFFLNSNKNGIEIGVYTNGVVDEHFLDLYGIKLLAGRNFQANSPADRNAILLSKTAVERLGFASVEKCIGARIIVPRHNLNNVEVIFLYDDFVLVKLFA